MNLATPDQSPSDRSSPGRAVAGSAGSSGSSRAAGGVVGLLLVGLVLVALTMRAPIIAIAPSIAEVRSSLRIGAGTAGLLTTIPVLCFGLGTPAVLALVRRFGLDNAVLIGLAGTLLAAVLRSAGGLAVALAGTLLMGLSITVGNVVIPVLIGRDFPGRTTLVTATYSSALNVGAMLATTLSAPLTGLVGWRLSLASWGLLAVLAAVVWRAAMRQKTGRRNTTFGAPVVGAPVDDERVAEAAVLDAPVSPAPVVKHQRAARDARVAGAPLIGASEPDVQPPGPVAVAPPLWRRPLVVGMVLAFAAQSFSYYGVSAWLPSLLHDDLGLTPGAAGASASIFQVLALVGAFAVPAMMARRLSTRFVLLTVCTGWATLALGLALAPALWPLWCVFGGAAQGGGFTVIFSVVVARAVDVHDSRRMSAAVQGFGYSLGATGPFVVGFVHSFTGGWLVPMLVVGATIALMAIAGSIAIGPASHRPAKQA